MTTYKHLLLATSLQPEDEPLAMKAMQIAEDLSARLSLLHVFESVEDDNVINITSNVHGSIHQARQALVELGRQLVVPVFDQRLVIGRLPQAILRVARAVMVDAVIIGSEQMSCQALSHFDSAPFDVIRMQLV